MAGISDTPWSVLGIAPTNDRRAIKRAYAGLLKKIDVAINPDAFITLRQAYDQASRLADRVSLPDVDALLPSRLVFWPRDDADDGIEVAAGRQKEKWHPQRGMAGEADRLADIDDDADVRRNEWHPERETTKKTYSGKEDVSAVADNYMEQLGKLLNDLYQEVNRETEGDDEKVEELFKELTGDPRMDNIAVRNIVEQRILNMCNPGESSHYLIILAYHYFAWGDLAERYDTKPPLSNMIALYPAAVRWRALKYGEEIELGSGEKRVCSWIISGARPSWDPLFWIRRKKVMQFVSNAEDQYPNLLNYLGREKILPWINHEISFFRGLTILVIFHMISKIWGEVYVKNFGGDVPLAPGVLEGFALLSISAGLYIAEYWRNGGLLDDYGEYRSGIEVNFLMPIVGLVGLVFLCGMLPLHWVVAFLSLPLSLFLFLRMGMDVLLSPRFNLSYFAERKLPFIILAILIWRKSLLLYFPQILFPSIFLVWAVSRAQPAAKQFLHQQEIISRWILNAFILAAALLWLVAFSHMNGADVILSPRINFLFYFSALLIVLGHDLLAFRLSRLDGYLLLITRIFFVAAVIFFHFFPLMLVVICRSASIIANSAFMAIRARRNGEVFYDSGYGLGNRHGAFRLELLDELIRKISAAGWITKIILTGLFVRIIVALAEISLG